MLVRAVVCTWRHRRRRRDSHAPRERGHAARAVRVSRLWLARGAENVKPRAVVVCLIRTQYNTRACGLTRSHTTQHASPAPGSPVTADRGPSAGVYTAETSGGLGGGAPLYSELMNT